MLTELFSLVEKCPQCGCKVNFVVDFSNKKGLAQKVVIKCTYTSKLKCSWSHATYVSETVRIGEDYHNRFDVNLRSIVAFREIGRGLHDIDRFNRVMNMCPPYSHSNYDDMINDISSGYTVAMNNSMQAAASNVNGDIRIFMVFYKNIYLFTFRWKRI